MKTIATLLLFLGLSIASHADEDADPAQVAIGERLFLETRFAQAYAAHPDQADPVMATTVTTGSPLPGPFAGQTMNCRACHMVDEHADAHGMRSYADYARRPPIPAREDGKQMAPRNSQSLVASAIDRDQALLLHFDGEFASLSDLVTATLTGRNYGWLPGEHQQAIHHVADVIRNDDGTGELAKEFGGSYRKVLGGDASVPPALHLPAAFRVDVASASDEQIVTAVSRLIGAYVADLDLARDEQGQHNRSPYDVFLAKNGIDRAPTAEEDHAAYSHRLFRELQALKQPSFVNEGDGHFDTHQQAYVFGARELAGLKVFLDPEAGNCAACHTPPTFTDFGLHNTGITQLEYDSIHGVGAFAALEVPDAAKRDSNDLPPSERQPTASGRFRDITMKDKPGHTDLGAWNTVLNPDLPHSQPALRQHLCATGTCSDDELLDRAFAAFKTPTLRDLGHSGPYMHNGSLDDIEAVVNFYISTSHRARAGQLRHAAPELNHIHLAGEQAVQLAAFLRALNEDYD